MDNKKGKILKKRYVMILLFLVVSLISIFFLAKNTKNITTNPNQELLRSMNYEVLTDEDKAVEGIENVEFSAFFLRDLDDDGYAERLNGTCQQTDIKDFLYIDLNVKNDGYLKNGKIIINGENFKWNTALVDDNVIKGKYIGATSSIELQDRINNGTQKLLYGYITSNIGNNTNNYSKNNTITFTGTYVIENDDNTISEYEVNKTVNLTVDWYNTTQTIVKTDKVDNDINQLVKDEQTVIDFSFTVRESAEKLLMQKQTVEVNVPSFNGYEPIKAEATNSGVYYEYNEETQTLYIERLATVSESGIITNTLARSNVYNIIVTYPIEAYNVIDANSFTLDIPLTAYNYGFNNPNTEFDNPYISSASSILTVEYSNPSGDTWNLYPFVGKKISKDNRPVYEISKDIPLSIYNGNIYSDDVDKYEVEWQVVIGNSFSNITGFLIENEEENGTYSSDKFLTTDNTYEDMKEFVNVTGVYFSNLSGSLGDEGWVKIYDAETDTLLETITSEDFNKYNSWNPYGVNTKSIKVETSKPIAKGNFSIFQIKEIDTKLLTSNYSKEEFDKLAHIYTYVKGNVYLNNTSSDLDKANSAVYEMSYSVQEFSISKSDLTNQENQDISFSISTKSNNVLEHKWKNGRFIIEIPEEIMNISINNIYCNVDLDNYYIYENNGKKYIKLETSNDEEQVVYITVYAKVNVNPLISSKKANVKLYAYNEACDNYLHKGLDEQDVDSDGNVEDFVGVETKELPIYAPAGLLSAEYITNYDDLESISIAPNVAEIEKQNQSRTANINVNMINNYGGNVSDVYILGKIPFEGNTYTLTGKDLKSKYTANITGPISMPSQLEDSVKIYYSTKETPTKELDDEENEWTLSDDVTDWKNIKTYLIDLSEHDLSQGENNTFTYEVKIPAGLGYNEASFSTHVVYANYETENGKLGVQIEPSRLGIQIVGHYNFELTKNKNFYDSIFVPNASYMLTTTDVEGEPINRIATTDSEGKLNIDKLYLEREYVVQEISSPSDYALNKNNVKFTTNVADDGTLSVEVLEGNFKEAPTVRTDTNDNYVVGTKVQDEAKYTLIINAVDNENNPIENVRYTLKGDSCTGTYKTDENGQIILKGLLIDSEYQLKEIFAEGYYTDEDHRTFKVVRDESGNLSIVTSDADLSNASFVENDSIIQPQVTTTINNEKIPSYKLQIIKVEENFKEEDLANLTKLSNAEYVVDSIDLAKTKSYKTNSEGIIELNNLYQYVPNKNYSGEYVINESKAPAGYTCNSEQIEFKVQTIDGVLTPIIENKEELKTLKNVIVDGETVTFVLQNKPLFKLIKKDLETGLPLSNVEFVIYKVDENGREIDYAKDGNGVYVGTQNENGDYVVKSDENGEIILPLIGGLYKAVEITYPEGYQERGVDEFFRISDSINEETEDESNYTILEINYIEDLVELSNTVNSGNMCSNYKVKLNKDLDFSNVSSYRSGIVNENLLESSNGEGFIPIGSESNFSGIFDGQNHNIKNLYINSENTYTGLFGYINNATIKNLNINGTIKSGVTDRKDYMGTIAGLASYSVIDNCTTSGIVESMHCASTEYNQDWIIFGGIVGYNNNSEINNCINKSNLNRAIQNTNNKYFYCSMGGVVGYNNGTIEKCENIGNVSYEGDERALIGGITGSNRKNMIVENCCNSGDINGVNLGNKGCEIGGIVGYSTENTVKWCYNNGNITFNNKNDGYLYVRRSCWIFC